MAEASPSPVMTMTSNSGFAILMPVAKAMALPWVVCMVLKSIYPAALEEQPIPETMTTFFLSRPRFSMACATSRMRIPFPQPGHQI